jgi:hypothetical protein
MEFTALGPHVRITQIFHPVDNGRSDSSSYTVVIGFTNSADSGDILFEQVMLSEIYH